MAEQTTVALKNDLSELERVAHHVEEFGACHALPARLIFELNLALDEVLTNVISYGYDDGAEHEIVVRLALRPGTLAVEVEDDGRAFNPLEVAAPQLDARLEDRPLGGLGIYLVRKLMDEVLYRRQDGKNLLAMTKRTGAL